MTTDFFQNIAGLNVPGNWKITIRTADNSQFTVSALFSALACGDSAAKTVPPMIFKGTPDELGEGFFDALQKPVQETAGLYANMETYLKEVERARLASKQEQDKKAKEKSAQTAKKDDDHEPSEPKPGKEEKKKAYDEAMKNIAELTAKMKYDEAIALLPAVEDYPEKKAEIEKKAADLKRMHEQYQNALFTLNQD